MSCKNSCSIYGHSYNTYDLSCGDSHYKIIMQCFHTAIRTATRKANSCIILTQHGVLPLTQNKSCGALTQHRAGVHRVNHRTPYIANHTANHTANHATNRVADLCPTGPTRDLPKNHKPNVFTAYRYALFNRSSDRFVPACTDPL